MPTYKEAYNAKTAKGEAARKKYKNFSDFEKAAKSYNTKKYGTTSPTAEAKKQGISKQKLAASVDVKKDQDNVNNRAAHGGTSTYSKKTPRRMRSADEKVYYSPKLEAEKETLNAVYKNDKGEATVFGKQGEVQPLRAVKIDTKDNNKIRSTVSLANNNNSLLENKRGKKKPSYKEFKAANPNKETHGGVVYKGKKGASFGAGYTESGSTKDGRIKDKVFDTKGRKLATVKQKKSGDMKVKKTLAGRINERAFKNNNKKQSLGDKLTSMTNSPRNQQAALNVAKGLKSLYKN